MDRPLGKGGNSTWMCGIQLRRPQASNTEATERTTGAIFLASSDSKLIEQITNATSVAQAMAGFDKTVVNLSYLTRAIDLLVLYIGNTQVHLWQVVEHGKVDRSVAVTAIQ